MRVEDCTTKRTKSTKVSDYLSYKTLVKFVIFVTFVVMCKFRILSRARGIKAHDHVS